MCLGSSDIRGLMLRAQQKGFTSDEYVFIYYASLPVYDNNFIPWNPANDKEKSAFYLYKQVMMFFNRALYKK